MKYMGWSWQEFCETPWSIVREVILIMSEAQEAAELERLMHQD